MYKIFWSVNLKEREHLEDLEIWEDNIRIDLRERRWEFVYRIHLAPDKDKWWALVNTAMNFLFHKR
jgi:hypothetical protein